MIDLKVSSEGEAVRISFGRLIKPCFYYIYSDAVSIKNNFHDGKRSSLLECVPIAGNWPELKHYQQVNFFCPKIFCKTKKINSLNLSMKDENGELIDFQNKPLCFEIEVNSLRACPLIFFQNKLHTPQNFYLNKCGILVDGNQRESVTKAWLKQ